MTAELRMEAELHSRRTERRRPRLGFLGLGWIGRNRMEVLSGTGLAEIAAVADPEPRMREEALSLAGDAGAHPGLEDLLELGLDGIVIATPSALHAEQALAALERGVAVFCQKPLGRNAAETAAVVEAAARADRLLGVDLSYRHLLATRAVKDLLDAGALGRIYALELVFHNAYGPDKPWFTRRSLAGGGCLIDLGTHLLDLALWLTGSSSGRVRSSVLLRQGAPTGADREEVEDFALAHLQLEQEIEVRLACSWFLPAGQDCVVEIALHGTDGGAAITNVGGSFYDFRAEHRRGTRRESLAEPPDAWGGRALVRWTRQLAEGSGFDPAAHEHVALARLVDAVYEAAS